MGQIKRSLRYSFSSPFTPSQLDPISNHEQPQPFINRNTSDISSGKEINRDDGENESQICNSNDSATEDLISTTSTNSAMAPFKSYAEAMSGVKKGAKVLKSNKSTTTNPAIPDTTAMERLNLAASEQASGAQGQAGPSNSNNHSTTQSTISSAPSTQRTNFQITTVMTQDETRIAGLSSLYHPPMQLSEDQLNWFIPTMRIARLYNNAGQVFRDIELLNRILDLLSRQVLARLQRVSRIWRQAVQAIFNRRASVFQRTGIVQNGAELRQPHCGICRWLKERSAAKDQEVKRGEGADTPHQEEPRGIISTAAWHYAVETRTRRQSWWWKSGSGGGESVNPGGAEVVHSGKQLQASAMSHDIR